MQTQTDRGLWPGPDGRRAQLKHPGEIPPGRRDLCPLAGGTALGPGVCPPGQGGQFPSKLSFKRPWDCALFDGQALRNSERN